MGETPLWERHFWANVCHRTALGRRMLAWREFDRLSRQVTTDAGRIALGELRLKLERGPR